MEGAALPLDRKGKERLCLVGEIFWEVVL